MKIYPYKPSLGNIWIIMSARLSGCLPVDKILSRHFLKKNQLRPLKNFLKFWTLIIHNILFTSFLILMRQYKLMEFLKHWSTCRLCHFFFKWLNSTMYMIKRLWRCLISIISKHRFLDTSYLFHIFLGEKWFVFDYFIYLLNRTLAHVS